MELPPPELAVPTSTPGKMEGTQTRGEIYREIGQLLYKICAQLEKLGTSRSLEIS
jgi:hypothetical protein